MNGTAVSSGMGTCGLVGPIGVYTGWVNDIAGGVRPPHRRTAGLPSLSLPSGSNPITHGLAGGWCDLPFCVLRRLIAIPLRRCGWIRTAT